MRFLKISARVVLLILVGVSTGVIWIYCSGFLPTDLAQRGASRPLAERVAGILTVLAMVAASAIPIQSLFPRHPVAAAVAIGWIPLALGVLTALPLTNAASSGIGLLLLAIEGSVDWIAIGLGAWAVSRVRQQASLQ